VDKAPLGLSIRPMTAEDVDSVLAMAAATPQAPHWPRAAYLTALDAQAAPRRIALVAECRSGIAAFAVASLVGAQTELESIVVAASLRRQGVARRLLAALVEELKRLGGAELLLEVRASNQPALELYGSCGFQPIALRSRYYIDPVEDAVLMKARLS